jgi:hypothetical protein
MTTILTLISLACLAYIFIEKTNFKIKPFNCTLCMGFWIGVIYFCIFDYTNILYAFIVSVLAEIIDRWMQRI